jgi:DNA-binding transcriptional ArsR family regulator
MLESPQVDIGAASVAAAIGEPARARMLYSLVDGRARTSTELSIVGEVSPSTASVHLARLVEQRLLHVASQGKHRYYSLAGPRISRVLEALAAAAGHSDVPFVPSTPRRLRSARTCYDHMAGHAAVLLRDRLEKLRWLSASDGGDDGYEVTPSGRDALGDLGIDVGAIHALRRRFAYPCVDWSERCPHIGGALGHAILDVALKRKWFERNPDGRALTLTVLGRRQLHARFGLEI